MADPQQPPRPRGRPRLPADKERSARFELRLTTAQKEKLDLLGGASWLRDKIDRAKAP